MRSANPRPGLLRRLLVSCGLKTQTKVKVHYGVRDGQYEGGTISRKVRDEAEPINRTRDLDIQKLYWSCSERDAADFRARRS